MDRDIYLAFLREFHIEDDLRKDFMSICERLGLSTEKIRHAHTEWLPKYYDLDSKAVRLCIAVYLREFIEVAKLHSYKNEGKYLIYGITPSQPVLFDCVKKSAGDTAYVGYPDFIVALVLTSLFGEENLVLDTLDKLDNSCRHCPLNRTRLALATEKIMPKPDILCSWGIYCDEATKMDELVDVLSDESWNNFSVHMAHDAKMGDREDEDRDKVVYLAEQYREMHREIKKCTGVEVTKRKFLYAMRELAEISRDIEKLTQICVNSNPQVISANDLSLFTTYLTAQFNIEPKYFKTALAEMIRECEEKLKNSDTAEKSIKLGCHFLPMFSPWVDSEFRKYGINLTFSSHHAFTNTLLKPLSSSDVYEMAAQQWLRQPNSVNFAYQIELMCEQLERYKVDGMLYGQFDFDRWLGSHQKISLPELEKRTGLRQFHIDCELCEYNRDTLGKIESLAKVITKGG